MVHGSESQEEWRIPLERDNVSECSYSTKGFMSSISHDDCLS